MTNNYWKDQVNTRNDDKNVSYKGKLQPGGVSVDSYLGKQKGTSSGNIGLSGKNGAKSIGIKPDSQGFEAGQQKPGKGYIDGGSMKGKNS